MCAYVVVIFLLQNSIYHRDKDHRKDDGWTVVKESGYVIVSREFVGTDLINLFECEFIDDDGCDMLFCFCCWICKLCKTLNVWSMSLSHGVRIRVSEKQNREVRNLGVAARKSATNVVHCSGTIHQLTSADGVTQLWCEN